jgi:hypothetical protein
MSDWRRKCFGGPSPKIVKDSVLIANSTPGGTWVETGTFLGETTALLAVHATKVYSLEPEPELYRRAKRKFAGHSNVEIINGASENEFPTLIPKLRGPLNFWLDGHYSAGATFKGDIDTPIIQELKCIEDHIDALHPVSVLVDDVRCFDPLLPEYEGYPPLDYLVDWARRNHLKWHIEHDIFIARSIS